MLFGIIRININFLIVGKELIINDKSVGMKVCVMVGY